MDRKSGTQPRASGSKLQSLLSFSLALNSHIDLGLVVILALPWALLSIGSNWIFAYVMGSNVIDPWFYFGFFLSLRNHLRIFPATYYGSRLSWILPGHLVYQVFSPAIAPYVLHIGLYYTSMIPFYLILKHIIGRDTALLTAVLMGSYGYFLLPMGSDYVDGPGIAYFLLTTLALTNAARLQRSWVWLVLGGVFYGAMVYTNLFLVLFTLPLLLFYITANYEQLQHSLKRSFLFFALGLLAISVLLGTASEIYGGDFLFYAPSIRAASELATQVNPYRLPFRAWRDQATWLVLPCLVVSGCIVFLRTVWNSRSDCKTRFLMLFQFIFLISAAMFVSFQMKNGAVLQYTYYVSFLIPAMFLAIGAQLAPTIERLSSQQFALAVCSALAILLLPRVVPASLGLASFLSSHAPWLVASLALMGTAVLFFGGTRKTALMLSLACLALALVNVAAGDLRGRDARMFGPGFQAIAKSFQAVRSVEPSVKVLFWYRLDEPMGSFYRSVASTYLWGYSVVNERFPSLEKGPDLLQIPRANMPLVILTNDQDAFPRAETALRQFGLGAQLIAERRIEEGPVAWNMIFVQLHNWPYVEDVQLTSAAWPANIRVLLESQDQKDIPLVGPEAHTLFQSDLSAGTEWAINRYGNSGGLSIEASCLAMNDNCGRYSSADPRDHLASPLYSLSKEDATSVFFSIWVKPAPGTEGATVILQNEQFETVAVSRELMTGKDGWVLRGDLLSGQKAKQLRMVVSQPRGSVSFLDKAEMIQVPDLSISPAKPRVEPVTQNTGPIGK